MAWTPLYPIVWLPVNQGGDTTSQSVAKHITEIARIYQVISNEIAPVSHDHLKEDITDWTHTHVRADITNFSHTHIASEVTGTVPFGFIGLWYGSIASIPAGWYLCNGSNGTPDLRDRFVVGAGNSYAVGATGGENTHTLTINEMPSHNHATSYAGWLGGGSGNSGGDGQGFSNIQIGYSGGGQAHENRPPYYALCYIMKA